jgi:hypothetical protein
MDAQITTIIKLLHDIQSLRSKPPPIQNRGAVGPTEPSFAPRDNSGQTSTPNMPSTAEEDPGARNTSNSLLRIPAKESFVTSFACDCAW